MAEHTGALSHQLFGNRVHGRAGLLARSRLFVAALFCLMPPAFSLATQPSPTGPPVPLYLDLHARAGPATSMIFGPGTIDGGGLHGAIENRHTLSAMPKCDPAPQLSSLRSFQFAQAVTTQAAAALSIQVRDKRGQVEPFREEELVLWRTGRYAECKEVGAARTLVYGAEWDIAFRLLPAPDPATSLEGLQKAIRSGRVTGIGYAVRGIQPDDLAAELQAAVLDWTANDEALVKDFRTLVTKWSAAKLQPELAQPIGILAK